MTYRKFFLITSQIFALESRGGGNSWGLNRVGYLSLCQVLKNTKTSLMLQTKHLFTFCDVSSSLSLSWPMSQSHTLVGTEHRAPGHETLLLSAIVQPSVACPGATAAVSQCTKNKSAAPKISQRVCVVPAKNPWEGDWAQPRCHSSPRPLSTSLRSFLC